MLCGSAPIAALSERAVSVEFDPSFSVDLGHAQWLQFTYELPGTREELFPPGLHPTTPVVVTLQLWRVAGGELGDFGLAQLRLSCRAGMRIRAFLVQSVIDGEHAARVLSRHYGYIPTPGTVVIHRRSDRIEGLVDVGGQNVLHAALLKPEVLEVSGLQHIGNMNLAILRGVPQLLQIELSITTLGLQRGAQQLIAFDGEFWRLPGRTLRHSVIGACADVKLALPPVRYVQDPALSAMAGTKKLDSN
ncbi:MAG TPA: hypothetical protein VGL34_01930 [Steroidobacteraceae bacterium]|jgi:hypothetical protein